MGRLVLNNHSCQASVKVEENTITTKVFKGRTLFQTDAVTFYHYVTHCDCLRGDSSFRQPLPFRFHLSFRLRNKAYYRKAGQSSLLVLRLFSLQY